jgi:methyltransferase (TIGR00027 family)
MFKSLKRIVYQVTDIDKAKLWYSGILNKQPFFDTPFAVIFVVGDCTLSLAKCDSRLTENDQRVSTYWEVEDIDAAFQRLVEAGARVRTPIRDVLNIRIAEVIDPFGNIIGISGTVLPVRGRSVEDQPSATAMAAAFCRALAARDERKEIRGQDCLAELFLTEEGRKPLQDKASRQWAIQNLVTSPLYGYFIARTAFIDATFEKSIRENIPQVVLLGAGYDTRAYRYRDSLGITRIFELDISATQKRKREVLRSAKIDIPQQVSFVSIDFRVDSLADVLRKASFDNTAKALFIWEGVTYYLAEETFKNTLSVVKTHSRPGSAICFDYLTEKLDSVNAAEPLRFWIGSDDLVRLLTDLGFDIVEHVDAKEMEKRYLTLQDGSLAERALSQFCFVYGRVSA